MRETRVRSLGGEDPLEKEMATHSSTLAWKTPWEEPGKLQSMGSQKSRTQLSNLTNFMNQYFSFSSRWAFLNDIATLCVCVFSIPNNFLMCVSLPTH